MRGATSSISIRASERDRWSPRPTVRRRADVRPQRAFFSLSVARRRRRRVLRRAGVGQGVFVRDGGSLETGCGALAGVAGGRRLRLVPDGRRHRRREPRAVRRDGRRRPERRVRVRLHRRRGVEPGARRRGDARWSRGLLDAGGRPRASAAVLRATSKTSCANAAESARTGIFLVAPGGISTIVLDGDSRRSAARTSASSSTRRASTSVTRSRSAPPPPARRAPMRSSCARSRPGSPPSSSVKATAPAGGSFGSNQSFRFADSGNVLLNAKLRRRPPSSASSTSAWSTARRWSRPARRRPTRSAWAPATPASAAERASGDGLRRSACRSLRDTNPPSARAAWCAARGSASGVPRRGSSLERHRDAPRVLPSGFAEQIGFSSRAPRCTTRASRRFRVTAVGR